MWIYQPEQPVQQANAPQPQTSATFHFSTAETTDTASVQKKPQTAQIQPETRPEEGRTAQRPDFVKCKNKSHDVLSGRILLFCAGLASSGVFLKLCKKSQQQVILRCGKNWLDVFSNTPVQLFSTLFLTAILLLTVLFMLGFCTFGRFFSKAVIFFYGIGSGVLCLQMFMLYGWRGWLFFAVIPGLYAAVLVCLLCRLSDSGGQVSAQLLDLLQKKENPPVRRSTSKALMDQYLVFCSLQIVCCGFLSVAAQPVMDLLL